MRVQGVLGQVQAFEFSECILAPLERVGVTGGWGGKGWLCLVMGDRCLLVSWRM
jgi:hypothetical protein